MNKTSPDIDFTKPLLLRPDNFTPLTRTPWGGKVIAANYKERLVPASKGLRIGESWEFSCDPDFPSRLSDIPLTLPEVVQSFNNQVFGAAGPKKTCEILVKLLNSEEPLSVQVHPGDNDADLKPDECGKPESWYVLQAQPGAGIYLGFSRSLSRAALRAGLTGGGGKELLQFVPVKVGDYFEIEPGVPHCIGPGITLLEPQRIIEGKSGKTYRLWDFDRLYNKDGVVDALSGKPRQLHLEEGLKLVNPEQQTGSTWVNTLRRIPTVQQLAPGIAASVFPANDWYRTIVIRADQAGSFKLNIKHGYASVTTLAGNFASEGVALPVGQSALIAAVAMPLPLGCEPGSLMAIVCPAYCEFGV